jgi:hypothetical protein
MITALGPISLSTWPLSCDELCSLFLIISSFPVLCRVTLSPSLI